MKYGDYARQSIRLRTVLLLMTVPFVWSCKNSQLVTERVRIEREVVRDTVVTIEPDSAMIEALIECDSNNQVLIKRIGAVEGTRLKMEAQTAGGASGAVTLRVSCREDSIREAVQVKDRVITDSTTVRETEYVEVEKPMTAWDQFLTVCGWILFVGAIMAVITTIIIVIWKIVKR